MNLLVLMRSYFIRSKFKSFLEIVLLQDYCVFYSTFNKLFILFFLICTFVYSFHNRCFVTGRPRGYYKFFGLSRHVLREMAHSANLPGVTKASW